MRFRRRLKTSVQHLAGTHPLQRTFASLPDDCMLVSYPRSGSTWLRFLLANVRHGDASQTTLETLNQRIPYALRPSAQELAALPRPRLLKSHAAYKVAFRRVVLLVRDPRDVAISYFHFHKKNGRIGDEVSLHLYVERYVRGEVDGYGAWGENVGSWLGARQGTSGFLLVRYEDLVADTLGELRRICAFVPLPASDAQLERAVGWGSASQRKASPGEWRDVLSPEAVARIEGAWGRVMGELGYELSGS